MNGDTHDQLLQILINSVNNVFSLNSPSNIFIPPPSADTPTNEYHITADVVDKPQDQNSPPYQGYTEK